jgi:hypothetical protein
MPARSFAHLPALKPKAPGPSVQLAETRTSMAVIATGLIDQNGKDNVTRYRGVVYMPGQRFYVDPLDVPELERKKQIQVVEKLPPALWWDAPGRLLTCEPGPVANYADEATPGALRIVQGTGYDPGNAAYRFHTAMNEHTKHASAFVRYLTRNNNPFRCPTQYNATVDPLMTRALLLSADVVHCHIDWLLPQNVGLGHRPRRGQVLVRHYHGTQFNGAKPVGANRQVPRVNAEADDADAAVLVGARLQICALRPGRIHWLPITVPVDRYAAMVPADVTQRPWPRRPFRVAHSPTKASIKGTREFLSVVKRLQAKGIAIEPVMIEHKTHADALKLKTTADACFDSFALGIQGSGLEAAAFGQPVIAGDADVADLYREHLGEVPYTFAPTWRTLETTLERLATDQLFYEAERRRAGDYVRAVHDYPAVARRYEAILADATGRTDILTPGAGVAE